MTSWRIIAILLVIFLWGGSVVFAAPPIDSAGEELRLRLQPEAPLLLTAAGERLIAAGELESFYRGHAFQPVWSVGGRLRGAAGEMLGAIATTADDGLDPRDYHQTVLEQLRQRFAVLPTESLAAELELLLSDAFIRIAADYRHGRLNPNTGLGFDESSGELARLLDQALASGQVRAVLQAQLPRLPDYLALRAAYLRHRQLVTVGGWPKVTSQPTLSLGHEGAAVAVLRQRLVLSGDLSAAAAVGTLFDQELAEALRRFQRRHGLPDDAIVGAKTLVALNVSVAERTSQLALNLERRRWLPRAIARRVLLVNIPAFRLELYEGGAPALAMRVIVGRLSRPTPELSGSITAIILNPQWDVPVSIASADLLPLILADADYLHRHNFRVFAADGEEELDPASVDWASFSRAHFPVHLRQEPGPANALGRLKFILPNDEHIYLHDTPSRSLFEAERRAFSSGCVRLEEPRQLALHLLSGTSYGDAASLTASLNRGSRRIDLDDPLATFFVYWSAWVDAEGELQFRPDLYRHDSSLAERLALPTF